ncbi:U3 small nucleolar RNA-associated protein [Coniosporium apollinis]|uniref:U3 small nucleolar RNA-associated protein n=1 Tax=Coniosporium apollinis TaxID=61459 RepID=A0ABQ9NRK7_9PEZI|nr:U3 small nucleolar RNA-associated protein [Coniosporium apollinis]
MDIHRSRFVPYPAAAINALAFSHNSSDDFPTKDQRDLRLAIGRANGNIEIWNPAKGAWVHETTLSGGKDRSVEGLAWTQEPEEVDTGGKATVGRLRLFSIGYSSTVTEWDLVTGLPLRHSSGNHSEVWSLAAQPRWRAPQKKGKKEDAQAREGEFRGQNLVAGCADGTLALLSTAEDDLRFQRFLSRPTAKKARVLSVTYQNRDIVVAGFADNMIRAFDTRNGALLRNISLGAAPTGGPRDILVWAVKCLPNGTIVSGDSVGNVTFFDGKTYSQTQRISGHEADVLDVACSQDGLSVYSCGMDRRTVTYKSLGKRWAKTSHVRQHEHDVKTMATFESEKMSVIASGGLDTNPIIIPLREHGNEHFRTLSGLPQNPPVASAPGQRLLVSWWEREVSIWRIQPKGRQGKSRKLVARMALKGEENIASASISDAGDLLAVSTAAEVKVFQIKDRLKEPESGLRLRKLENPLPMAKLGAKLVTISADGRWLAIITHNSSVLLARISKDEQADGKFKILPKLVELKRLPRKQKLQTALVAPSGRYEHTITRAQFSTDSRVLVVGDLAGHLDSWVLEGHPDPTAPEIDIADTRSSAASDASDDDDNDNDDEKHPVILFGQHWIPNPSAHLLPKLDSAPLFLSFRPSAIAQPEPNGNPAVHPTRHNPHPHSHDLPHGDYRLLVLSAQHRLYEFDVLNGSLTDWSRRNPTANLPAEFQGVRDRAMGCVWDTSQSRERVWLYGSSWLFMFDLARDFPPSKETGITTGVAERKRKRGVGDGLSKGTSGAGSRVPQRELPGLGRKMRKTTAGGGAAKEWVTLGERQTPVSDEESEADAVALSGLRVPGDGEEEADGDEGHDVDGEKAVQAQKEEKKNWLCAYKYRPILGMVPIGRQEDGEALEVVLVERPLWDLELPPRFVGNHERE